MILYTWTTHLVHPLSYGILTMPAHFIVCSHYGLLVHSTLELMLVFRSFCVITLSREEEKVQLSIYLVYLLHCVLAGILALTHICASAKVGIENVDGYTVVVESASHGCG